MIAADLAGRPTSRIGFGCGRLVGGVAGRQSFALIETALELGIRHFDTAPSYGLGSSEDVLGAALAGVNDVTIVTKVGLARPRGASLSALARQMLRPLLSGAPAVKASVARLAPSSPCTPLTSAPLRASFEESLRRLKRDRVTGALLHEIEPASLDPEARDEVESWRRRGLTEAIGSGTGGTCGALTAFSEIAQYRFEPGQPPPTARWRILHGALRRRPTPALYSAAQIAAFRRLGRDFADPSAWPGVVLTLALAQAPDAILLVSSTRPDRLRSALAGVDWSMAARPSPEDIRTLRNAIDV